MNNSKIFLSNAIDGVSRKEKNSEGVWKKHFMALFNSIHDNLCDVKYESAYTDDIHVTLFDVESAVSLDVNKSCGLDDVYAKHFKHNSRHVFSLLTLYTTIFILVVVSCQLI